MTDKVAKLVVGDKTYEFPVLAGTVGPEVIDIRSLYAKTGLFTYDPGFTSTAACDSAITYIDGDKGELMYRGYPIDQLADKSTQEGHVIDLVHLRVAAAAARIPGAGIDGQTGTVGVDDHVTGGLGNLGQAGGTRHQGAAGAAGMQGDDQRLRFADHIAFGKIGAGEIAHAQGLERKIDRLAGQGRQQRQAAHGRQHGAAQCP